jgi:hypothetical protein
MKRIRLSKHAEEQAEERGATLAEVKEANSDRFLTFNGIKTATGKIAGRVSGKANARHLTAFSTTAL